MSNWYKLNLPQKPTKDHVYLKQFSGTYSWNIYTNPLDLLSDKVQDLLMSVGARPNLIVVFEDKEQIRTLSYLHKDLTWKNDQWQTVPCAINWELQPVQTTISWFNTDACQEYWPKTNFDNTAWPRNYLNGIGYQPDHTPGIPEGAVMLQKTTIDHISPILFRTDVAHAVQFKSQLPYRFMCSLRFSNIHSWDHAVEVFDKVITN